MSAGLGSSAAYGCALSAALFKSFAHSIQYEIKENEFRDAVFDFTNFCEKLNHGKPSGADAAIVNHGGLMKYQLN